VFCGQCKSVSLSLYGKACYTFLLMGSAFAWLAGSLSLWLLRCIFIGGDGGAAIELNARSGSFFQPPRVLNPFTQSPFPSRCHFQDGMQRTSLFNIVICIFAYSFWLLYLRRYILFGRVTIQRNIILEPGIHKYISMKKIYKCFSLQAADSRDIMERKINVTAQTCFSLAV